MKSSSLRLEVCLSPNCTCELSKFREIEIERQKGLKSGPQDVDTFAVVVSKRQDKVSERPTTVIVPLEFDVEEAPET